MKIVENREKNAKNAKKPAEFREKPRAQVVARWVLNLHTPSFNLSYQTHS